MSAPLQFSCVNVETSIINEMSALPRPTAASGNVRAASTQYRSPSIELPAVLAIRA